MVGLLDLFWLWLQIAVLKSNARCPPTFCCSRVPCCGRCQEIRPQSHLELSERQEVLPHRRGQDRGLEHPRGPALQPDGLLQVR